MIGVSMANLSTARKDKKESDREYIKMTCKKLTSRNELALSSDLHKMNKSLVKDATRVPYDYIIS